MADTFTGTAYCVKCKEKRDMTDAPIVLSVSEKSGRETRLAKAECPVCGTKMSRLLPKVSTTA